MVELTSPVMQFRAGQVARADGLPRDANPWPVHSLYYQDWMEGFDGYGPPPKIASTNRVQVGDRVTVHMHAAQKTLLRCGEVLYVPTATGDMWGFRDLIGECEVWTSEPITIDREMQSR